MPAPWTNSDITLPSASRQSWRSSVLDLVRQTSIAIDDLTDDIDALAEDGDPACPNCYSALRTRYSDIDADTDSILRHYEDGDEELRQAMLSLVGKLERLEVRLGLGHTSLRESGMEFEGVGRKQKREIMLAPSTNTENKTSPKPYVLALVEQTSIAIDDLMRDVDDLADIVCVSMNASLTTDDDDNDHNKSAGTSSDTFSARLRDRHLLLRKRYFNIDADMDSIWRFYEDGDEELREAIESVGEKIRVVEGRFGGVRR